MALPEVVTVRAHDYAQGVFVSVEAPVVAEYPITLLINGSPFISIACSGTDLELLALGHLMTEGIFKSPEEIEAINVDEENLVIDVETGLDEELMERLFRVHTISSGCGQGRPSYSGQAKDKLETTSPMSKATEKYVTAAVICPCVTEFLRTSELHKKTGGVHSAALYSTDGRRIVFFNEIGRHNAVDKLIGYAVRRSLPLGEAMILSTGRLSSEIISKAIAAKTPIVVSKASPTSLSVEMARESGIVMIGNVKGRKFRVYSGSEHIQE